MCAGQAGLWDTMRRAVDVQSAIPLSRWDINAIYAPELGSDRMTIYARFAALCHGVDLFDAAAFRLPDTEALAVDPQVRCGPLAAPLPSFRPSPLPAVSPCYLNPFSNPRAAQVADGGDGGGVGRCQAAAAQRAQRAGGRLRGLHVPRVPGCHERLWHEAAAAGALPPLLLAWASRCQRRRLRCRCLDGRRRC